MAGERIDRYTIELAGQRLPEAHLHLHLSLSTCFMIRRGGVSQKVHGKVHVCGSRTSEHTRILDEALELGLGTPFWAL